jgi:hypothetical protein
MEKYKVTDTRRFKFDGTFSLSNYYRILYDVCRSLGYDVYENRYVHKKLMEGMEEVELVWTCLKDVDGYARIRLDVKTLVTGMKKVQVQIEGANVGRENGSCELQMAGNIETDYLNRWETNPILRMFKKMYDNYVYRDMFKLITDKTNAEVNAIENELKAFFNMQKLL